MTSSPYFTAILALLFVLALMGLLGMFLKRLGLGTPLTLRTGAQRLKIVETLPLTAQHRAIILQRDHTEHLVILGPNGETVVESQIEKNEYLPRS